MLFHVEAEFIETGALLSQEQFQSMLKEAIVPSLDLLAEWEEQGKISGGVFPGERAGTFVIDATSPEELSILLTSIPFWGIHKWNVKALQSWKSASKREHALLEQMRA